MEHRGMVVELIINCCEYACLYHLINLLLMQVISVTLDEWSNEQLDFMEAASGHALVNLVYKDCIPSDT